MFRLASSCSVWLTSELVSLIGFKTYLEHLGGRSVNLLSGSNTCEIKTFMGTVYDQNKAHARTTKFWGCTLFKNILKLVLSASFVS